MSQLRRSIASAATPSPRSSRGVALAVVLGLAAGLVAGCSGASEPSTAKSPGPVPPGVEFHPSTVSPIPAPQVVGELIDGTPADTATLFASRPVLISFIASWCTACEQTQADLAAIRDTYGDAITLLSVAGDGEDTREDLDKFVASTGTTWPVVYDPDTKTWRNYAISEAPAVGIIDSAGTIVRLWPGGTDRETLEAQLSELVTLSN